MASRKGVPVISEEALAHVIARLFELDKYHKSPQDVAMWHRKYKELYDELLEEQKQMKGDAANG